MELLIYVESFFLIIFLFVIYNLLRKSEKYEEIIKKQNKYINDFSLTLDNTEKRLKDIDDKGSFEADDEIGFMFKEIKSLHEVLSKYNIYERNTERREIPPKTE